MAYSEFEKRYEPESELKWLGDYIINALVFLKGDLGIQDDEQLSELINCIWRALDFQNTSDQIKNGGPAVHSRYNIFKTKL